MKNWKMKATVLLMAAAMLFTSCGGNEDIDPDDPDYEQSESEDEKEGSSKKEDKEEPKKEDEEKKDNISNYKVKGIGTFYDGIAAAYLGTEVKKYYYSGGPSYTTTDYYYTYIDLDGNLLMPAEYIEVPAELNGAAKVRYKDGSYQIINEKGEVLVKQTENVKIGNVSKGLYWVMETEELLSGPVYTLTYYNTKGKEVFSFENTSAVNAYSDSSDSNFTKYGYAIIQTGELGRIINTNGEVVFEARTDSNGDLTTSLDGTPREIWWDDIDECIIDVSTGYFSKEHTLTLYTAPSGNIYFDPRAHEAFAGAAEYYWATSEDTNELGRLVSVYLENSSGVDFFAVADEYGNVTMKPQTKISIINIPTGNVDGTYSYIRNGTEINTFRENLCAAQDTETRLYGYINAYGEWVIEPTLEMVTPFHDGYAVVDYTTVIDTTGKVVLQAD